MRSKIAVNRVKYAYKQEPSDGRSTEALEGILLRYRCKVVGWRTSP
jgi:hypothetical protein